MPAGINMLMVPTKKAMAVITKTEYFFKKTLEIVVPITHEIAAKIIKKLPVNAVPETVPVIICGKPTIVKAPKSPKTIPKMFTKNIFSFKNYQPANTDSIGIINESTDASMTVVRLMPSKKKVMFKVMIKTPMATSFGRSFLSIFTFFVSAKKNGAKSSEAKANLRRAKLIGGNSCRVILATTKLAPQIKWARIKTM